MQHADAAIAGAGIIGLAAALELASAGLRVVVFERGRAMRECSWAAAGMLAGGDPENPVALRSLSELSLNLYPDFLATVERLSGCTIPIRTTQTLQGAHELPPSVEELSANSISNLAPGLHTRGLRYFLLQEQSLDPRDLARALPKAAQAAGVVLLEDTAVRSIGAQSDSVHIQTSRGTWSAINFINACGAWASDLADIPIAPRKGHMLLVQSLEPLTAVIRTPELYLVPRGNGRLVIGATVEDAGYSSDIDPAMVAALHNAAAELWPPIRGARIIDQWTGLRPASSDLLPVIGSRGPRSWLALGHFRNGILLAPATARLLRQMILAEPLTLNSSTFDPHRFTATSIQA